MKKKLLTIIIYVVLFVVAFIIGMSTGSGAKKPSYAVPEIVEEQVEDVSSQ